MTRTQRQGNRSYFYPGDFRVILRKPRVGDVHPLGRQMILRYLKRVAEIAPDALRGLRAIELRARPGEIGEPFGRYRPGERRIELFSCPPRTWRMPSENPEADASNTHRFESATVTARAEEVEVDWPDPIDLEIFYVGVLMHELGHHRVYNRRRRRGLPGSDRLHEELAQLHADRIHGEIYRRVLRKIGAL